MELTSLLLYAFAVSILFLLIHMVIAHFKFKDVATLMLTIADMILAMILSFLLLKNGIKGKPVSFIQIFEMLATTMAFSVVLLALNAAYNPYAERKPLRPLEIVFSLLIFAGGFALMITALIWYLTAKG